MSASVSNLKKKQVKSISRKSFSHDHSSELPRLNRIKGQIEGVERMINEKRYCPEIIIQIKAIRSALQGLESNIAEGHIRHCVTTAVNSRNPTIIQEKLNEIVLLLKWRD